MSGTMWVTVDFIKNNFYCACEILNIVHCSIHELETSITELRPFWCRYFSFVIDTFLIKSRRHRKNVALLMVYSSNLLDIFHLIDIKAYFLPFFQTKQATTCNIIQLYLEPDVCANEVHLRFSNILFEILSGG